MAKRVGVDKWLFGVVLLLVLFGLVMVFSASAVMAKIAVRLAVLLHGAAVDLGRCWADRHGRC